MSFARLFFLSALCSTIVATSAAQLPSAVQGPPNGFAQLATLTPSDGTLDDDFGRVVAVSSDGNTVAVSTGGYHTGGTQSAVYVFTKPASGWTSMTQVARLTGSNGGTDELGISVTISGDGNTIVAGAPYGQGAAYVFVKPASGWADMNETAQLIGSDAYQSMGDSVAISGNTVVVGAGGTTDAAYVFVEPATGWTNMTQTAKLTSSLSRTSGFGECVAIDGNIIVVGGQGGRAFLFVEPSSGWTNSTETARLSLPEGSSSSSVAVSGSTAVVGYPNLGGSASEGAVYVYVEPASGWTNMSPTATLTAADGHEGWLGWAVAIQGNQIFAGAPATSVDDFAFAGAIYQYTQPSTGWKTTSHFNSKTVASDAVPGEIGLSVAFGGDLLISGAPYGDLGAAYVFAQ
jgi:hypothetical protein